MEKRNVSPCNFVSFKLTPDLISADLIEYTRASQHHEVPAIAYLRTSSAANVGADKDSEQRQRAAITGFAKANGYAIETEFYDAAVSGADPVTERPGFLAMLQRIAGNGIRTIIVESPDRFARDLAVQLAGHDMLKGPGDRPHPGLGSGLFH